MPRSSSPILLGCLQPSPAAYERNPFGHPVPPTTPIRRLTSAEFAAVDGQRVPAAEPYRREAQPGAGLALKTGAAVEAAGLRDDLLTVQRLSCAAITATAPAIGSKAGPRFR